MLNLYSRGSLKIVIWVVGMGMGGRGGRTRGAFDGGYDGSGRRHHGCQHGCHRHCRTRRRRHFVHGRSLDRLQEEGATQTRIARSNCYYLTANRNETLVQDSAKRPVFVNKK